MPKDFYPICPLRRAFLLICTELSEDTNNNKDTVSLRLTDLQLTKRCFDWYMMCLNIDRGGMKNLINKLL